MPESAEVLFKEQDMQIQSASQRNAVEAYFPPPERQGGWRSLVTVNQEPTSIQKEAILATTSLDWDKLREAWAYCQGYAGLWWSAQSARDPPRLDRR